MTNWVTKLLGLGNHKEIDEAKNNLFQQKQKDIRTLKEINKRFKFVIESENIELIIRNMDTIRK
jgi:hypothetical protein